MIILEFSLSQRSFHKTTISEMITINFNNAIQRKQTDYLPIAIFNSESEVDTFLERYSEHFKDYSMYKNTNGETVVK